MSETLAEQLANEESMFVQTAQSVSSEDGTLTLRGITASTLYFSDRPQRVVGHMATTDFVDLWGVGHTSTTRAAASRRVPTNLPKGESHGRGNR